MSLRQRIFWVLVVKLAALTLLYGLFFAPSQRIKVDARHIGSQWFDSTSVSGE